MMKYKIPSGNDIDSEIFTNLRMLIQIFFKKFGRFSTEIADQIINSFSEKLIGRKNMQKLSLRILWLMREDSEVSEKMLLYIKEVSEDEYIIIQKIGKDFYIKSEIYISPNLSEAILNYAYLIEDCVSPISYAIIQKTAENLRKKGYKSTIRAQNRETYESIKAELISVL